MLLKAGVLGVPGHNHSQHREDVSSEDELGKLWTLAALVPTCGDIVVKGTLWEAAPIHQDTRRSPGGGREQHCPVVPAALLGLRGSEEIPGR